MIMEKTVITANGAVYTTSFHLILPIKYLAVSIAIGISIFPSSLNLCFFNTVLSCSKIPTPFQKGSTAYYSASLIKVMIGFARKNTTIPTRQTINPRWKERLFSSPPNAVNAAITIIPMAKIVIPNDRNSSKTVSSKLLSDSNNLYAPPKFTKSYLQKCIYKVSLRYLISTLYTIINCDTIQINHFILRK